MGQCTYDGYICFSIQCKMGRGLRNQILYLCDVAITSHYWDFLGWHWLWDAFEEGEVMQENNQLLFFQASLSCHPRRKGHGCWQVDYDDNEEDEDERKTTPPPPPLPTPLPPPPPKARIIQHLPTAPHERFILDYLSKSLQHGVQFPRRFIPSRRR